MVVVCAKFMCWDEGRHCSREKILLKKLYVMKIMHEVSSNVIQKQDFDFRYENLILQHTKVI